MGEELETKLLQTEILKESIKSKARIVAGATLGNLLADILISEYRPSIWITQTLGGIAISGIYAGKDIYELYFGGKK